MYQALFDFFYHTMFRFNQLSSASTLYKVGNYTFDFFGNDMRLIDYFCYLLTHISIILIVVLCCLFVYRLIKLVGRLFSGGTL